MPIKARVLIMVVATAALVQADRVVRNADRSFAAPANVNDPQPSRYCGTGWKDPTDLSKDDGGVHDNSGIQNHFFYLLCEGGKGWDGAKTLVNDGVPYDDFEGIGVELAARIAYQTLTAYCGPRTDYREVRAHWLDAALDVIEADKADGEIWTAEDIAVTNAIVKAWAAVMPFEWLKVPLEDSEPGEKVAVVGLAGWDDELVKEVDGEGNVSLWVPANLNAAASRIFRIGDRLFQVPNSGEGSKVQPLDDVSNLDHYKPETGDDMRITDVEIDWNNRVLHMVIEVENGDEKSSANPSSPTISHLVRLRRSSTLPFGGDAEDFDISQAKMPFVEEGAEEPTPNKYSIDLKLPKDSSSGFYRLEW